MTLLVALLITFLLLLCLYWAPSIGRNGIHPVAAQILGVGAVGLVHTTWALENGLPWLPFWLFFVAGGLPSLIGIAADKLEKHRNRKAAQDVLSRRNGVR